MNGYTRLNELFRLHLQTYLEKQSVKKPQELYAPENYILTLGGKRVRPLLALIACDLFEQDPSKALNAALSVELFHNFSLIHDDILDAAPLRRGEPTVHHKWNTNIAILSGDMMLVRSLEILNAYSASEQRKLQSVMTTTAIEVCEGQQMDMNFEKLPYVTTKEYLEMITKKTAVLLGCSLKMGAICAGVKVSEQNQLYKFGMNLGIAFQLMDDILDLYSEGSGKQAGGDVISGKKTILLMKAIEIAGKRRSKTLLDAYQETEIGNIEKVKKVRAMFDELGTKEQCLTDAKKFTDLSIQSLNKINAPSEKKELLKQFAEQLLNRNH